MIQLAEDCLVFKSADGESIPYSADMITVEVMGETTSLFDTEFIKHAAAAVFHYFRDELDRESVTMSEFSLALEKILRGFDLAVTANAGTEASPQRTAQADLCKLVAESDAAGELYFFPRLRDELRAQLRQSPQTLCFQGLRPCVKKLVHAQRWSERCQKVQDQIVDFLRLCISQENHGICCALIVK